MFENGIIGALISPIPPSFLDPEVLEQLVRSCDGSAAVDDTCGRVLPRAMGFSEE